LGEAVVAPAPDSAVGLQRAGVAGAAVDRGHAGQEATTLEHLDRLQGERPVVVAAGVVAELPEMAGPPAPDRAVRLQGAGGVVVRRNGLDAGQLPGALDDLH